jgi:hypothetical protein
MSRRRAREGEEDEQERANDELVLACSMAGSTTCAERCARAQGTAVNSKGMNGLAGPVRETTGMLQRQS